MSVRSMAWEGRLNSMRVLVPSDAWHRRRSGLFAARDASGSPLPRRRTMSLRVARHPDRHP